MEIRPIYAAELERRKRRVFPIRHIGGVTHKTARVDAVFDTFNFSFIMQGGGRYSDGRNEYVIEAPCVLVQRPGESNDYGPSAPWGFWDEIYIVYDGRWTAALENSFRLPKRHRHWRIEDPEKVSGLFKVLGELTRSEQISAEADRIDLTCEALIMESLPMSEGIDDPALETIVRLRNELEAHFATLDDVDALARRHGLSRSVFRRLWPQVCAVSPSRYLMELKLKHACRLLVESKQSIGAIAEAVGFNDSLYFSRKFRQNFEMTATAYRKKYLIQDGR